MNELYSYGMLSASTVMFGFMFFFKDIFRRNYGSGLKATFVMSLGGNIVGTTILLLIKGFSFEFSPFALIMALCSTVNGLLFSFCSLKALGKINLSLYSLFSMLGGMALPFMSGILFHGEPFTVGKAVCFVVITLALLMTIEKGEKKGNILYYLGVFTFNGMSGVISKLYQALPFDKISPTGYSVLKAMTSFTICLLVLFFLRKDKRKLNWSCIFAIGGSGILSHLGNWLLQVSLVTLHASAQYPFVTGGTMIVSTVISMFTDKKPSKKEICAVCLSFIGLVLFFVIPEIKIF